MLTASSRLRIKAALCILILVFAAIATFLHISTRKTTSLTYMYIRAASENECQNEAVPKVSPNASEPRSVASNITGVGLLSSQPLPNSSNGLSDIRSRILGNRTNHREDITAIKTVILYTNTYIKAKSNSFASCPVSSCRLTDERDLQTVNQASVLLFLFNKIISYPQVDWLTRSKQHWIIYTHESPSTKYKRWTTVVKDGMFNMTLTYRRGKPLFYPFGMARKKLKATEPKSQQRELVAKLKAKKKGAFVYISNSFSFGYNRTETVKELQKYIDIDVFGDLTGRIPCTRMDFYCEAKLHTQYRFYLSFENSLCTDYITEKFWNRLKSEALLVPVAIGGLSLDEYTDVAPPNSFIHALNFSSISELGKYLSRLMTNDEEYMAYHQWRGQYEVITSNPLCEICALAHSDVHQSSLTNLANWWNENTCKYLTTLMDRYHVNM